jgi:hypothetical protein
MSKDATQFPAARGRSFIGGSDARIMGTDEAALIRLWREKRGEAEPEDLSQLGPLIIRIETGRSRPALFASQTLGFAEPNSRASPIFLNKLNSSCLERPLYFCPCVVRYARPRPSFNTLYGGE